MKRNQIAKLVKGCRALVRSDERIWIAVQSLGALCAGFLLSGISLLSQPAPMALCLLSALPFGFPAVLAFGGLCGGYLFFWGLADTLSFIGSGFLILAGLCIFRDLLPTQRRWFLPIAAGSLFFLVGFVLLTGGSLTLRSVLFLLMHTGLLSLGARSFRACLDGSRPGRGFLSLCLAAGFLRVTLPGGLPLGALLACGAAFLYVSHPRHLEAAALCGLMLDLCWQPGLSAVGCLVLASMLTNAAGLSSFVLRYVFFNGCILSFVLFPGGSGGVFFVCCLLGSLLPLLVPDGLIAQEPSADSVSAQVLSRLGAVFADTARLLRVEAASQFEPQSAAVFDKAADEICRSCAKYGECWHTHASETYRMLSGSAGRILERGSASKDDLPSAFVQRCLRTGSFLAAVNDALDTQLARRQYLLRLREIRTVVSDTFFSVSQVFSSFADEHLPAAVEPKSYFPELGFRAEGMRGAAVSGDRGVSFQSGEWYYLLLCDGMGTGPDAAQEAAFAITLLKSLIESGFDCAQALGMLNGFYVLLDHGGFSSVDLLQLSLSTGEGFLHKWGAAPSYLKRDRSVQKIGTASTPPGLSVGEAQKAACVRLSLQEGEQLVLCSDGAAGPQTELFLQSCGILSSRDLASGVVGASSQAEPDDRMAAVLSLHPIPVQAHHTIRAPRNVSERREHARTP